MTSDAELIERLRSMSCYDYAAAQQAADRLAALIAGPERKEVEFAEVIDRLEATGGHNKPCHNCGTLCNGLAGNPGLRPICLPVEGQPTWFCTACIASMRDKAAKNEREVAAIKPMLSEWHDNARAELSATQPKEPTI